MVHVSAEVIISCSPDDAWKLVGDVANIADWVPQIEHSELYGDHRTVRFVDGAVLQERILNRDDETRSYHYEVLDSPFGFTSLTGSTEVHADPAGCKVIWSADITPDELGPQIQPMYAAALDALRERLTS